MNEYLMLGSIVRGIKVISSINRVDVIAVNANPEGICVGCIFGSGIDYSTCKAPFYTRPSCCDEVLHWVVKNNI